MDFFNKKPNDELKKVEKEVKLEKKVEKKAAKVAPAAPKLSALDKARQQVKDIRAGIAHKELELEKIVLNRGKNIEYDRVKLIAAEERLWKLEG